MKTFIFILILSIISFNVGLTQQEKGSENGWGADGEYYSIIYTANTIYIPDSGQIFDNKGAPSIFPRLFYIRWGKSYLNQTIPNKISTEILLKNTLNLDSLEIYLTIEDSTGSWYSFGKKVLLTPKDSTWEKFSWNTSNAIILKNLKKIYFSLQFWTKDSSIAGGILTLRNITRTDSDDICTPIDLTIITKISDPTQIQIPKSFELSQNYPNPFNPSTKISYTLQSPELVTLRVYDVLGNEVAMLVNQYQSAGSYTTSFDAGNLASGMYFYKLEAGSLQSIKKMMLLK